jgi:hypothetical protein
MSEAGHNVSRVHFDDERRVMLIDCGQCEFHKVACGDCLITALLDNGSHSVHSGRGQKRKKDVSNSKGDPAQADTASGRRHAAGPGAGRELPGGAPRIDAFGALELRALGTLAAAGLVPPLRYRPVGKVTREIVALYALARAVIGKPGTTPAEVVEMPYCFH